MKFNPFFISVCMSVCLSVFIYLIWLHVYSIFVNFQVNNWRHNDTTAHITLSLVHSIISVLNFMMAETFGHFYHSVPAIKSNKNGIVRWVYRKFVTCIFFSLSFFIVCGLSSENKSAHAFPILLWIRHDITKFGLNLQLQRNVRKLY